MTLSPVRSTEETQLLLGILKWDSHALAFPLSSHFSPPHAKSSNSFALFPVLLFRNVQSHSDQEAKLRNQNQFFILSVFKK